MIALLRGFLKKRVSEIQKKLSDRDMSPFVLQAMKEAHHESLAEVTSVFQESLAATAERLTFPSGEGGWRKAEAEESSLSFGSQSQRKRQKVKNVPTLKVTRVKKVMKVVKFMYQFIEGVNQRFWGGGESEGSGLWKGRNVRYLFCLGLGMVTSNITILERRNNGRGLNSHTSMG